MKTFSLNLLFVLAAAARANEDQIAQAPKEAPRDVQATAPVIVASMRYLLAPTPMPPNGASVSGVYVNGQAIPVQGVAPGPAPGSQATSRDPCLDRQPGLATSFSGKGKGGKGKGGSRRGLIKDEEEGENKLPASGRKGRARGGRGARRNRERELVSGLGKGKGKGGSSSSGRYWDAELGVWCTGGGGSRNSGQEGESERPGGAGGAGLAGSREGNPEDAGIVLGREYPDEGFESSAVHAMATAAIAAAATALWMVL